MRLLCLLVTLVTGTALAGIEMKKYTIDVPKADPATITYPSSWVVSNITARVPPGKIAPPAVMFTSPSDTDFWARIVFMSAELSEMTTQEAVDALVRKSSAACLEGKLPPDLKLRKFKTKDSFGSYAELKDPKWDDKEHAPGVYHPVISAACVLGRTGAAVVMTAVSTNSPCYSPTIQLITNGITTIRQMDVKTE